MISNASATSHGFRGPPHRSPTGCEKPPLRWRRGCHPRRSVTRIVELAKQADKRIVLPEGSEPRTIRAAALCAQRGIARCVLLGNPRGNPPRGRRHGSARARGDRDHRSRRCPRELRRAAGRDAPPQGPHPARCARFPGGQRLARHRHARARRGGRPGLRRGPHLRQHHPARPPDHQDPPRTPRWFPRSSSCACPTRCWSTATAP